MSAVVIEQVRKKFAAVQPVLTERARRLWAGAEADAVGRGGVAWVAAATGLAISTVRKGRDEARAGGSSLAPERSRRAGAGRKRVEDKDPGLLAALDAMVSPTTRGDPESPLRWTTKSVRLLSNELRKTDHPASPSKVGELLRASGYSLQANAKTKEGVSHPDRNAQFEHINAKAHAFLSRGLPVISVDAKKKEFIGQRASPGREWEPKGSPIAVESHDFFDTGGPSATPYGVYDLGQNMGFVNVGTNHNTPTFAALSIEKWWDRVGAQQYPRAKEFFVTADAGGSNACKSVVFKHKLQEFCDRAGVSIHVSHFPPGTSKWNKIEHRLFSFITLNWRGRPLSSYEVVVALIAATSTAKGLRVNAELDTGKYPLGVRVPKHQREGLNIERAHFHGEWNYVLRPRSAKQLNALANAIPSPPAKTHAEMNARWRKIIRQQTQSGMNPKAFCAREGHNYWTFLSARRRFLFGQIRKSRSTPD